MKILALLIDLLRQRRGSVTTVFLLTLPILIGMAGLAVEYGDALVVRTQNQRVADAAAYSAALAYNASGNDEAVMRNAATRIGGLNGLTGTATVAAAIVPSPADASRNAVQVTITQSVPLVFSSFIAGKTALSVPVVSTAELVSTTSNCILALDSASTGVTLSGGVNISAPTCGVASNQNITISNCGPYIKASSISYNNALSYATNCGGLPPLRKADNTALAPVKKLVVDPYASSVNVTTPVARLATVNSQTSPAAPVIAAMSGGNPVDFDYSAGASTQATANGCAAVKSGNTWTYDCPPGSTKTISTVTIRGGLSVQFNTGTTGVYAPNSTNVLNINTSFAGQDAVAFGNGTFNISGHYKGGSGGTTVGTSQFVAMNVGTYFDTGTSGIIVLAAGTYNIVQGMYMNGSAVTTIGASTFNIGRGTISCSGAYYSICALSSGGTTIAGPSTFNLSAGIRTGGGATIQLGSGDGNSYKIGPSSEGYAFRGDGGAKTLFANATQAGNVYQFGGHVNLTGGGSCLIIGAAPQHDIKGNLWGTGAMKLGAGIYTITGSVNFGGSGGGDSVCGGSTIGLYADNVTLVIGASAGSLATSGDCSGQSFCLSAGYSNVVINAPTTGTSAGFAVIGPTSSSNTAGGHFTSGATNSLITGVLYMPYGPLNFDGGAALGNSTGGCLEVIGKYISVTQGGLLGSSCISSGGASNFRVRLVG